MTIEGVKEFEALRDFLYSRMRGVKDAHQPRAAVHASAPQVGGVARPGFEAELARTLREVAAELRAIRQALESKGPGSTPEVRDV